MIAKTHNEIAIICRDAILKKGLEIKELSVVPWDNIIFNFSQGMAGTELDTFRIENTFLACVRNDERYQALLTPQQRKKIAHEA